MLNNWDAQRERTMLFEALERVVLEEMSRTLQASMRIKLGLPAADLVARKLSPLDAFDGGRMLSEALLRD